VAESGRRVAVDPRPTLDELDASWSSCPASETFVFDCSVGGLSLRVEGRGQLAERLVPALLHHPRPETDPDLTIRVWDLAVAHHRPHLDPAWFQSDGDEDVGTDHEVRIRYDPPQRAVQAWDAGARRGSWVAEDPADLAWWEEAAPLRPMLAWWQASNDRYFAHGAALAIDGKAVLLVGPGGSGKSTTALRAQRAGLDFLGDDYCLVAGAETGLVPGLARGYAVGSVYRTVKLRPVDGPASETQIAANDAGRKTVLALDTERGGLLESAELVGVAAVGLGAATTEIEWGRPTEVLRALAPTTFVQLPGIGRRSFAAFGGMLRSLPSAVVRLGHDPDEVVDTVRALIEEWS
jgi:hypothetical protein